MRQHNILLCTNKDALINIFEKGKLSTVYGFAGYVTNKDEVVGKLQRLNGKVDIVIVTEALSSNSGISTISLIRQVHSAFKDIRIIYIAGEVDSDDVGRINSLGMLVKEGIYDIYHQSKLNSVILQDLIDNPKTYSDVAYLTKYLDSQTDISAGYKNVVMVSSIKPGSGKSMIAVNMAVAIAKYGVETADGKREHPRVAIVEGDLQTLSVGTLLQIENHNRNVREALRSISRSINDDGYILGSDEEIEKVRSEVLNCFVKHHDPQLSNLYVLAGSQMSLNDLNIISPYHYYFLITTIIPYFDVIIVDTNSSLEHKTTAPLFELADHCYYILDLDSNNIRNNIRYRRELEVLGVAPKIKYILNRDLTADEQAKCVENLSYSSLDVEKAGFKLIEKIPMVDMSIVYNRIKRGSPIVLDTDPKLKKIRDALLRIANSTYQLDYSLIKADEGSKSSKIITEEKPKKKPWWKFWA